MNALVRHCFTATAVALLTAVAAYASDACPAGQKEAAAAFEEMKASLHQAIPEAATQATMAKAQAAVSTQVAAPGAAQGGTSIVDRASFPALLGMAVENGLLKNESNVTTADLNFFAFLSMARPQVLIDQSQYERYDWLRRFGGTAASGGKGLKFDRDGDGKADDPVEAKALNDIVTWEVHYRASSTSRDPRDEANYKKIATAVSSAQLDFSDKEVQFLERHTEFFKSFRSGCVPEPALKAFLERSDVRAEIAELGKAMADTLAERDTAVESVATQFVWSLFAGGVERKAQFGPNSKRAGVRFDWRKANFNVEWMRTDPLPGRTNEPESWKAGLQYSTKWLKGGATPDGIDVSASGTYERFRNDPAAKHDTVASLNVAFAYPIATGMKIPVSATWANHEDLLTGERDIRGHIGFTIDFSKLTKPKG